MLEDHVVELFQILEAEENDALFTFEIEKLRKLMRSYDAETLGAVYVLSLIHI